MTASLYYTVTLKSDVAFRSRAGAGAPVDFVPGLVILGRVARRYRQAGALSWSIFHSGEVRFGDARLLSPTGEPARVVPLSFKFKKGVDGRVNPDDPRDKRRSLAQLAPQENPAKPDEYKDDKPGLQVWHGGQVAEVAQRVDLKTSVLYSTQRAREGALFHVPTLAQGQVFGGRIDFDFDDDEKAQRARAFVLKHLPGQGRLGWSRRAEYGRVQIECSSSAPPSNWRQGTPNAKRQRFMLLSDACLLDLVSGQPTATPCAEHFGIDGQLDTERSFIRLSRYTPFNAHHRRPGMERVTLQAGSVITFTGVTSPVAGPETWTGLHTAEGLGRVWVEPPPCTDWMGDIGDATAPAAADAPDDELAQWLNARLAENEERRVAEVERLDLLHDIKGRDVSPSQWRRVARAARKAASNGDLAKALFEGKKSICASGVAARRWKDDLTKLKDAVGRGASPLSIALAAEDRARTAGKDDRR